MMTMKIYAVREAGTFKIHGVFWADSQAGLWDAVDEMGDPSAFEYSEITSIGGIWHDQSNDETIATTQYSSSDEEEFHFIHPLTNSGELTAEQIMGQDRYIWQPFDASNEGVGLTARTINASQVNRHQRKEGER